MKTIISSLLTITLLISCEKKEPDYISYDSEIFSGSDTMIYGEWKYLYSTGGLAVHSIDIGVSILSVVPIGDYAFISKNNSISKGKLLMNGELWNHTAIRFCNNGINDNAAIQQLIMFNGPDTLILMDPAYDAYSHYYKRIK